MVRPMSSPDQASEVARGEARGEGRDAAAAGVTGSVVAGPVGLGLVLVLAQGLRFVDPSHAIDDAWISFRIARNWVEHGVLSFNLDVPRSRG